MSQRLEALRKKLRGRTGANGKPIPGYEKNCAAIEAEISKLEMTTSPSDPKSSAVASKSNKDQSGE